MIVGRPIEAGTDPTSNSRILAALCYFLAPLVGIIVLIVDSMKDDEFLRFHGVQSLGFAVAVAVYTFLASIVYTVLSTVTLGIGACCLWVLFVVPLAPWLYYSYLASQDKYFEIPWLTEFMVGQNWLYRPYEGGAAPEPPVDEPEAPPEPADVGGEDSPEEQA